MDQELADAAAYAPGRRCACTHQMAALFYVKVCHCHHLDNVTSNRKSDSVYQCVFTWRIYPPRRI